MHALLEAGKPEEALLLFFRDIVKMPSQEIAAVQAMPTWRAWVAAAHTDFPRGAESRSLCLRSPAVSHDGNPTVLFLGGDSPPAQAHHCGDPPHRVA